MKSVTICGSMRFAATMTEWADYLQLHGVTVHTPDVLGNHEWEQATPAARRELALTLANNHFAKMKTSDTVFIYNEHGYVGTSVMLELGYAIALQKPIYALTPDTDEVCRDVWFSGYYNTKETLLEALKN